MPIPDARTTHIKGLTAELEFSLHLIKKGWNIFLPINQNSRVDMIIEKGGKLKKLQIKYCTPYKGCLRIELEHPLRKTGSYSIKEVDDIGVYDPVNDKFYLVPLAKILPRKEIWIRVSKTVKNQQININWAKNYLV